MKTQSETERFIRYRSVIDLLLERDGFRRPDVYEALKDEKTTFIGKVINELLSDGWLTEDSLKSKPRTKALDQAVKRNEKRFPPDFMLQLTDDEFDSLRSQIVTSKGKGGRRYLPYAFTEQGVAMFTPLNA